jgi:hypothetical protein
MRWYRTVVATHVLALQASFTVTDGAPPFRMLPGVGNVIRGYASTRYIDNNRIGVQAEYRAVPVWWRLGFVAFAGVGEVAHRLRDFRLNDPKVAVGFGLRFLLFSKEKITIRQDFGFGKGSSGDYLDLNEAF